MRSVRNELEGNLRRQCNVDFAERFPFPLAYELKAHAVPGEELKEILMDRIYDRFIREVRREFREND